ncbi:MAG TPA: response regulator transcription factor [Candidatus Acidoferrales bacterium]|jgi:DNA-binding NarL/FixJ family response regulator|nr:response regulator transcription factor [Candidatus Acidoferrales bacterium]
MFRILIADDSQSVRLILKDYLALRSDVEVCGEAVNGAEAVQKAKALEPDLVLMDLAMPEMNGAEATSVLKRAMPDLSVILFTMYAENIGRQLTSAIGVDAVLCKPDGMTQLGKVIDTMLRRSRAPDNPGPHKQVQWKAKRKAAD